MLPEQNNPSLESIRCSYFIRVPNVGDLINPSVVSTLTGRETRWARDPAQSHLLAAGSMMAGSTPQSHVWGTGVMHPSIGIGHPRAEQVYALRGKLSYEAIQNAGISLGDIPLGDPGYLAPSLLDINKAASPKFRVGIVAHYVDRRNPLVRHLLSQPGAVDLNVHDDPFSFLGLMAECEYVVSSSLHGLIFAEALGIPNLWIKVGEEIGGGTFKYKDWFSTTKSPQTHPYILREFENIEDLSKKAELHDCQIDTEELKKSFPHDQLDAMSERKVHSLIPTVECRKLPLPVFLISYNRGEILKKCIASINNLKRQTEIIIHDNGSDDPETLQVLSELIQSGIKVIRSEKISNADELNLVDKTVQAYFSSWAEPTRYAVSDCDIDLSVAEPCALEVYDDFLNLFRHIECVGPMLRISDIPKTYPLYNRVMNRHIEQFWHKIPRFEIAAHRVLAYQEAPIDTTFAIHRAGEHFRRLKTGLRLYHPFEALHLDWYKDENVSTYAKTSSPSISHFDNTSELDAHKGEPLRYSYFYAVRDYSTSTVKLYREKLCATESARPAVSIITANTKDSKKCVFSTSDDKYVSYSAVALLAFVEVNPNYDAWILSNFLSEESKAFLDSINIRYIELSIICFRGFGTNRYPVECFYHLVAPHFFSELGYHFSVYIDGDILCRKKIDHDLYEELKNYHVAGCEYDELENFILGAFPPEISSYFIETSIPTPKGRINTGVLFYNNKKFKDDNIIFELYKVLNVLELFGYPPKGDDSLFALLCRNSCKLNVLSLEALYNNNKFENIEYSELIQENIYHLHRYKPWEHTRFADYPVNARLLANDWLNVMLDCFPEEYIKKYFPLQWKDISLGSMRINSVPVVFFKGKKINFGDSLSGYLSGKLSDLKTLGADVKPVDQPHVLGVGSILRLCTPDSLIWGSGIRNFDQKIATPFHIFSCRGTFSLKALLSNGYSPVSLVRLGDPGLMLPSIFNPSVEQDKNIAVIPHVSHYEEVFNLYKNSEGVSVINLETADVEKVIAEILRHKFVASTSLHGLIVADAYGIPSIWLRYKDTIMGDYSKFYDHYSSIGIHRDDVHFLQLDSMRPLLETEFINLINKHNHPRRIPSANYLSIFHNGDIRRHLKYLLLR